LKNKIYLYISYSIIVTFIFIKNIEKHFIESSNLILSLQNFKQEINDIIESIIKCDKDKKKFLSLGTVVHVLMQNILLVSSYALLIKELENLFRPYL
jgi:hypothetical protein